MLTSKITDFPPWNNELDLNGKFLQFQDDLSMCEDFTMTYFLLKMLLENKCVNIITVNHGKPHYENLLRKHGIDFALHESNDRILLHELNITNHLQNKDIREETVTIDENIFRSVALRQVQSASSMRIETDIVYEITNVIKSGVLTSSVVIIDDLEALELLCPTSEVARSLLKSLLGLLDNKKIIALAVFGRETGHPSRSFDENPSEPSCLLGVSNPWGHTVHFPALSEVCKYRADVFVVARALETGYAGEVHGSILVVIGLSRSEYLFRTTVDGDVFCCKLGS